MQAGRLDQIITFESNAVARDSTYKALTETWSTFLTCAAEVQFLPPTAARGEQVIDAQVQSSIRVKIRTRYYAGIGPTMRINHGGKYYRIQDVAVFGRNEELRITAVEWNEGRR
jgi:head-tail adaptor